MTTRRKGNARRLLAAPPEPTAVEEVRNNQWTAVADDVDYSRSSTGDLRSIPATLLRMLWGVIVVVGIAVGVTWGVYRYTTTSPRFAVKDLQVKGLARTSRESILQMSGVTLGDNLFRLNLGHVEACLLKNPWVREAHVTRKLPSTLRVDLEEREAAAIAVMARHLFLVTRVGEAFKEAASDDPSDLPSITGVTVDDSPRDPGLEKQRLSTALDVLHQYSQVRLSRIYPAEEVHLTPGGEVVLMVGPKGTALYLGFGPWPRKLSLAERVFAKLQAQHSTPSLVFLDNRAHPERVVVRVN